MEAPRARSSRKTVRPRFQCFRWTARSRWRIAAAHVHVGVVRVPHEGMATPLQLLVHFVEEHVGEQRRQGTSLRSALLPLHHYPVHHYPGVEIAADQPQHTSVPCPLGKLAHEHVVVDPGCRAPAPLRRSLESAAASPAGAGTSPQGGPCGCAASSPAGRATAPPPSSRRYRDPPCSSSLASARLSGSGGSPPSPSARGFPGVCSPSPPSGLPRSVPPSGLHPYSWTGAPSLVHLWLRPFETQAPF